jgi:ferritin-like metal-binding protein YciE
MECEMGLHTLEDLYARHLEDLYNAEQQIREALPRIAQKATLPELKNVFDAHIKQTERQIERLEKIFTKLQKSHLNRKCIGVKGLLRECKEVMTEEMDPIVRDAALIATTKRVKDYEISAYRAAIAYARLLKDNESANLFTATLEEEKQMDEILGNIALEGVNKAALVR